jgi:hypothetical protein
MVERKATPAKPHATAFRRQLKETHMSFAELCLFLGALFTFATLILKVIEVARSKAK